MFCLRSANILVAISWKRKSFVAPAQNKIVVEDLSQCRLHAQSMSDMSIAPSLYMLLARVVGHIMHSFVRRSLLVRIGIAKDS